MTQRDMMRKLLIKYGYNEQAVCAAYAEAERAGLVLRMRNKAGFTPEGYATAVWRDGHKQHSPWILHFCRNHGIVTNV